MQPITILLVEDNRGDVILVREAFKNAKILTRLNTVGDGEEAITHLASHRPDLILLDLNLPKKSGREVLTYLRASPEFKSIPVVVMTGSKSESDMLRAEGLDASEFMVKPLDFAALLAIAKSIKELHLTVVVAA